MAFGRRPTALSWRVCVGRSDEFPSLPNRRMLSHTLAARILPSGSIGEIVRRGFLFRKRQKKRVRNGSFAGTSAHGESTLM
jgi:hypothetical protein